VVAGTGAATTADAGTPRADRRESRRDPAEAPSLTNKQIEAITAADNMIFDMMFLLRSLSRAQSNRHSKLGDTFKSLH
jgi:hypothetical protein